MFLIRKTGEKKIKRKQRRKKVVGDAERMKTC